MFQEAQLDSIFKCVGQDLFANNDENHPVSFSGSAFVVRYRGRLFVVTAAHVLKGFALNQIRVHYRPDSPTFLPLLRPYNVLGEDTEDTEQYDIMVLAVDDTQVVDSLFGEYKPCEVSPMDALVLMGFDSSYAFRGFLTRLRNVDYENKKAEMASVTGDGAYLGRTARREVHQLRVKRASECMDLDGLSGSPIFQIRHQDGKYSSQSFAGMILRGTAEAGTIYFLESPRSST